MSHAFLSVALTHNNGLLYYAQLSNAAKENRCKSATLSQRPTGSPASFASWTPSSGDPAGRPYKDPKTFARLLSVSLLNCSFLSQNVSFLPMSISRDDNSESDNLFSATPEDALIYRVLIFAGLRDVVGSDAIEIQSTQTSLSVADLLQLCATQFPDLARYMSYVRVAVNSEYSNLDQTVCPSDEIAFIPPVSGGQELFPLVELTLETIDTARVIEAARSRLAGGEGAVLTFEGVIRDNANSQQIEFLEYDCYAPMAMRELQKIVDEVRARWDLPCAMTHRSGRVEIGEASVVICVASPHRGEAFEACRFAIDTIKKTVPIWKKEVARDNSWWVENTLQHL